MQKKGKIVLEGLVFHAHHGVHPHERLLGNKFEVDISVNTHLSDSAFCEDITGTIDYEMLYVITKEEFEKTKKKLMEPIAYTIAKRILDTFERAEEVKVAISKLTPPIGGTCKKAKIEVSLTR